MLREGGVIGAGQAQDAFSLVRSLLLKNGLNLIVY
jgi:hypothetical protein